MAVNAFWCMSHILKPVIGLAEECSHPRNQWKVFCKGCARNVPEEYSVAVESLQHDDVFMADINLFDSQHRTIAQYYKDVKDFKGAEVRRYFAGAARDRSRSPVPGHLASDHYGPFLVSDCTTAELTGVVRDRVARRLG